MKYYNLYIILLLLLIICNTSFTIDFNGDSIQNDNQLINNDNDSNKPKSKSHLFLLSIPDCSVEGIVLELGKCFNFESYGCLPTSIMIKANKINKNINKLNTNITNINEQEQTQQNDYYGIVFYNTNCNSHDENEVIEFECKKSKKIKLMGNVKLQCLSSDKDLQPVFLDNSNNYQYYSSSSMEKIKIYGELKPLIPNNDNNDELYTLNNKSNKSIILNFNLIIFIIITIIIINL